MGVLREGLLEEKGKMNLTWPSQTIAMTKGTLDSPQNSCTNTLALDFYTVGRIVVKTVRVVSPKGGLGRIHILEKENRRHLRGRKGLMRETTTGTDKYRWGNTMAHTQS